MCTNIRQRLSLVCALLLTLCCAISQVQATGLSADGEDYHAGGFYALYAQNRREGVANYITEDFLLQGYSLLRARRLRVLERTQLLPALEQTLRELATSIAASETPISARTQAYVDLLQALLSGDDSEVISEAARAELQLIRQAKGLEASPLWSYTLDYSQFKPRAQYAQQDAELQRYFVASQYANSVIYPLVASAATGVSEAQAQQFAEQARELSRLLDSSRVAPYYRLLTTALDWQFGHADDLTATDVLAVEVDAEDNLSDALRDYAQANDKVPSILSLPVRLDALEAGLSAQQSLIVWRLLPSRRSADAQAMQSLVVNDSAAMQWPCHDCKKPPLASAMHGAWVKAYPSFIEIMALHGNAAAQTESERLGLSQYSQYERQLAQAQAAYDRLDGLQTAQLPVLRAALAGDHSLQALHSGAGFWLWQRSLGALYQKQSSTAFSKSVGLDEHTREGASLASNTALYKALYRLSREHEQHDDRQLWGDFSALLKRCVNISETLDKQLPLQSDDNAFLNSLDTQMQAITGRDDAPIVIDLHSNYQDQTVLQLGLAYPKLVHQGEARGARFNVREFSQALPQRLDNQAWRQQLQGQK